MYRLLALILLAHTSALAYAVLTHESIVDATWDHEMTAAIRRKFPNVTAEQLQHAHAYAYGGCLIHDMGYYPFSSKLFSDLTHYVRAGDFVEALLRDARDPDEYAFALGALAHYAADDRGHPLGVNPAVALIYPKLRREYGDAVTYADSPSSHLKTEFAFDVVQVAQRKYAPETYHDEVGFEVCKPLLERAFRETYDLELGDVIGSIDLALGTFRRSVGTLIPEMTKVAWRTKRKQIAALNPGLKRSQFLYRLSRKAYEKDWGDQYRKLGCGAKVLAFLFKLIPKVGPFEALAFRLPTAEAEALFLKSLDATILHYRELVAALPMAQLPAMNLDTGQPVAPGRYSLANIAYRDLLHKHAERGFRDLSPALRRNILTYLNGFDGWSSQKEKEWRQAAQEVERLRREADPARL